MRVSLAAVMTLVLTGCAHPAYTDEAVLRICRTAPGTGDKKYARFLAQTRQAVFLIWGRNVANALHRHDATGGISDTVRFTVLTISLDKEGLVRDVQLKQGCGAYYLNDAAVAAVQESSPLPSPPSDLLRDGIATFDLGFCVEFGKAKPPFQSQDAE